MEIGGRLTTSDASRLRRVFDRLERCGLADHAVVGGLALDAVLGGKGACRTALNDIDLAVPGFAALPASLGDGFLVHHVHRDRPQGKLIAQFVCPVDAVRIDVFGARGALLARAGAGRIGTRAVRIAALDDMASRIVSELMSLVHGGTAPTKAARDYFDLIGAVMPATAETAWGEQRRGSDPDTFAEACGAVEAVLARGGARLTGPSRFVTTPTCPHCGDPSPFRLADPERVRRLIGHY